MISHEILIILYFLMWYFLIAVAILFIITGLDDLFFNVYYWMRHLIRKKKSRHYEPLTYEKLISKDEQWIAVLIPAWQEASAIGTMLRQNAYAIDYKNYYFFVGVYPNDLETSIEAQKVANILDQVEFVVHDQPGSGNKASILNTLYQCVKAFEKKRHFKFNIFVFHNALDIIHPLSFKLYNYLMPDKEMVQIPVFPTTVSYWNFTHWLYADEFAENHTKDMIVREAFHSHLPSAGIGTALSRNALELLEKDQPDAPFATDSFADDYRTSLKIHLHQLKQIFVTQFITRMKWQKGYFFQQKYILKPRREYIAIHAIFPKNYQHAVSQKANWIIGLLFQEWQQHNGKNNWIIRYSLARDWKALLVYLIYGLGYLVFFFWLIYSLFAYFYPNYPNLQTQLVLHPWAKWVLLIVILMILERLMERIIATHRIYGWLPALLAIPRAVYGNIVNLHALLRAYRIYFKIPNLGKNNRFLVDMAQTEEPFLGSHVLAPYRQKLGDLLVQHHFISKAQLDQAILEQQITGERLGQILCRAKLITQHDLLVLLSLQYHLPIMPKSQVPDISTILISQLPRRIKRWLSAHGLMIIGLEKNTGKMLIALEDPTNELLIKQIIRHIKPYQAQFVLIDDTF